jgi:hypothetical protein
MTRERATSPELTRTPILAITGRATAATPGPWGYLRPSGVICAPGHQRGRPLPARPGATFIVHARTDIPCLLGQLQAERSTSRTLDARLLDCLILLRAAIQVANDWLNKLPWQGDGLHSFVADGLDRDPARWVGQVIEEVATALDPETLGVKDGAHEQHRARGCGRAAGCQWGVGGPAQPRTPPSGKGVVARLT